MLICITREVSGIYKIEMLRVIWARLKFPSRESRLDVGQRICSCYWFPPFLGHPVEKEYRDDGREFVDPHTTSPDDCAATLQQTHARDTHGLGCCRPEKERDTTKWRATGVWTLRTVKVVAYFTSWLRETFSSYRSCVHARTERGGVYSRSDVSSRSWFPPLVISRMMHGGRKCRSKDQC